MPYREVDDCDLQRRRRRRLECADIAANFALEKGLVSGLRNWDEGFSFRFQLQAMATGSR